MFEKILPGLWRFQSRLDGAQHPCNGYLLQIEGRWVLIDPPQDLLPELLHPLIGKSLVSDIYITHLQSEHVMGAMHYPSAVLHVPVGDEYLCNGPGAYAQSLQTWASPWDWASAGVLPGQVAGARTERPLPHAMSLGESLQPGESLGGFDIVATPGHGRSAVTLRASIEGRLVAFCGDLIYSGGRLWNWFDCDWDMGAEIGQKTLLASARRLRKVEIDLLCPAHGAVINHPTRDLDHLILSLDAVLCLREIDRPEAINFPEPAEKIEGWRELSPHLYQWKTGNAAILISDDGHAMVIDDGLGMQLPRTERERHHDAIFQSAKKALGIKSIEWIAPTHYHGAHTDLISHLARTEGAQVVCLDSVAGPLENPDGYSLAGSLKWYGVKNPRVTIDRKLSEGERFTWRGYDIRFLHLGGETWYTQGIEVVIDGRRVLFVGDSFWGAGRTAGPVLTWNDAEPVERGAIYALRRMIECAPDLLVCGEGSAVRDPNPFIRAALTDWLGRMAIFDNLNPHVSASDFFSPFHVEE